MAVKSDYVQLIKALLPPGVAFPRDDTTSAYAKVIDEIAELCAQLDRQARQLVEESDPFTMAQSFGDWETEWGLPDECVLQYQDGESSITDRRAHVIFKSSLQAGQSRQFFIDLAKFFNRDITIEELRDDIDPKLNHRWRVNVRQTDSTTDEGRLIDIREAYPVNIDDGILGSGGAEQTLDQGLLDQQSEIKFNHATVMMQADDPLAYWGDQLIECVINRHRPAHTTVLFAYI